MTKVSIALVLLSTSAFAGPGFVGNGDGGADLEGATPITGGPIADTRAKAVELLYKLNVQGVRGLGFLIPEIESSPLYLARDDRRTEQKDDQGTFHSDMQGRVYARTFAHPHAATRFFPVALALTPGQLVALHVHEGLHRSLPASIAEDEGTVTALTLAITSPNASFDQIQAVAAREIPSVSTPATQETVASTVPPAATSVADLTDVTDPHPPRPRVELSYEYSGFGGTPSQVPVYESIPSGEYYPGGATVSSLQKVNAKIAPFSERLPLSLEAGIGIVATSAGSGLGAELLGASLRILDREQGGGLGFSAWDRTTFSVGSSQAYTLSGFSRMVNSFGVTLEFGSDDVPFKNSLYATSGGNAGTNLVNNSGNPVLSSFAPSFHDRFSFQAQFDHIQAGGFVEAALGSSYRYVDFGTSPPNGIGSTQLISSFGPELAWVDRSYSFTVDGRFVVPSSSGSFDTFGDLWNEGTGTATLSAKFSVFF